MPLGIITIEEREANRWTAELEVGFPVNRRGEVRADTLEGILEAVRAKYREYLPAPWPVPADPGPLVIDESKLPQIETPVGKRRAQEMRNAADGRGPGRGQRAK